jgi:succinyl-CoA synthetase beta subunit
VEEGRRILNDSGLTLVTADTLTEAAQKVVAVLKAAGAKSGSASA